MPALSLGYFQRLAVGEEGIELVEPVLQVLRFDLRYEQSGSKTHAQKVKRARLALWDGGTTMALGVLATNLNVVAGQQLSSGQPFIRLKDSNLVTYRGTGGTPIKIGIFVLQYQFLYRSLLAPVDYSDFTSALHQPLPSQTATAAITGSIDAASLPFSEEKDKKKHQPATDLTDEPVTGFHRRILEFQNREDTEKLPEDNMEFCKPGARLCSRYGVTMNYCIAEHYEHKIKDLQFLDAASAGCYFVDQEIVDMKNNHRRNLLYWWFATNIYFVKGAGKRQGLPPCLEACIRMAHPNNLGDTYVQFKKSRHR